MTPPVRVAIFGLGGFAACHHEAVARLEERGLARLVATCEPDPAAVAAATAAGRFAARGVRLFADYRDLLAACRTDLDLVVIPTPIPLHAPMHDAATAAGLPCYVEKPPTLDPAELERMIAADTRARKASLVGFNFIVERPRLDLRTRLLAGEFGALRGATLHANWPRPGSYFTRNAWAGRLRDDAGRTVLDSCFGNAMAHFVHNLLFWAGGPGLFRWAELAAVRAELYRAHRIESADTFFVEADTVAGVPLRFAVSHACSGASFQTETVLCDKAVLRYSVGSQYEIRWHDGRVERTPLERFDALHANYLEYFRYLRDGAPRPATTLADARAFVALHALSYLSSGGIHPPPPDSVCAVRDEKEQKDYLQIAGLPAAQENFLVRGVWPGGAGWGRPPAAVATPADLARFPEFLRALAGK